MSLKSGFQAKNKAASRLLKARQQTQIVHLRQLIQRAERRAPMAVPTGVETQGPCWQTGVAAIDAALPGQCLSRAGVHEISGASHGESVVASAYLAALLKQLCITVGQSPGQSQRRHILWCQTEGAAREFGLIHGAGLSAFGLDPAQILFVQTAKNTDLLWALEEGVRTATLCAVIGECDAVTFTHTRRLSLAAAAGNTPILLLRPYHDTGVSAADTRWRVQARPGGRDPFVSNAPGNLRWHVALTRCRGGMSGAWDVEWNHETHRLHLARQLCARLSPPSGAFNSVRRNASQSAGTRNAVCAGF